MYKCVQLFGTKNKKITRNLAKYVYFIFRELSQEDTSWIG